MSRVKLTEYRAKKILLGDTYKGVSVHAGTKTKLPGGQLVVKVDQGVKGRMKKGLVVVGISSAAAVRRFSEWKKKGFSQFIVEPLLKHKPEDEQYLSFERVREGIRMLHTRDGGIDVEAHPEAVKTYVLRSTDDIKSVAQKTQIPETFLRTSCDAFEKHFFAFLEINPLVVREGKAAPLDAAVLVDSAGTYFTRAWGKADIVEPEAKHKAEARVEHLQKTTPASLKLNVLNKNGALFFLLSGGGGSIVIADEAHLKEVGNMIGNYGEYSGGPTREETYLYAKEVIALLLASRPTGGKKALIVAGGVANFTDVAKTFAGVIDALSEAAEKLREQKVKVFVRRGGPNEAKGLALMREFLKKEKLFGAVYGSDEVITKAVSDAIAFVKK